MDEYYMNTSGTNQDSGLSPSKKNECYDNNNNNSNEDHLENDSNDNLSSNSKKVEKDNFQDESVAEKNIGNDPQSNDNRLQIRVRSPDGNEVFFRIKSTTSMKKLMHAYCQRLGQPMDSVRFLHDGDRIRGDQIAADLGLENGDTIDAMIQQVGGN